MKRQLLTILVGIFIVTLARGDDGRELLSSVVAGYESLKTYEFEGTESVALPGTDCILEIPIVIAAAPPRSSGISFLHGDKPSKTCLDAVTKMGGLPRAGAWSRFKSMDVGVKSVRELASQTLTVSGAEIRCVVLEVLYDDYYQRLRTYDGPVRFWIDAETRLVRRVEFKEKSEQGPRAWTATIEKISIGGPPATWLTPTRDAAQSDKTAWIGKQAPDFELRTVDGELVHLAALRGKVVVLDFWATWCGPCLEAIPPLEKLQAEAAPAKMVILGVSGEDAKVVSEWRKENERSFRTLVGAEKTAKDFGVGPIPTLVVIDPQGVIVTYVVGFDSERQLRGWIGSIVSN
jgi:thiol-disulfide isomerase/thioredoxin